MKKVILMLVVALSVMSASAQIKVGANAGLQVPTEDCAKLGFGGAISGEYLLLNESLGVGLNVGFYAFGGESYEEDGIEISGSSFLIPVALTGRYYFLTEAIRPYAGVDLGLYNLGYKITAKFMGESASDTETVSKFGLAPVIGLQYGLSSALALDVNAKYNLIFTEGKSTNIIGFNVGVVYKF